MSQEDRHVNYENLIEENKQTVLNGLFGISTPYEVSSSMAFAHYLHHVGINARNYLLFLKLVEGNNKWVVDQLLGTKDPRLLFSSIRPTELLISRAFELLSFWHPGQIYQQVLLIILGIIENTFYKPDDGFRLYRVSITDLHNIGKFLEEEKEQSDPINEQILAILDRLTWLGEYERDLEKSVISKHAYNIRDSFFDTSKKLSDIIPRLLLIRLAREEREVGPTEDFFANSNKNYNTSS